MIKFRWLILILLACFTGYLVGVSNKHQNFKTVQKSDVSNSTSSPQKPLGFFTSVETPKGTVYLFIDQDFIDFNPVETPYYEKAPTIKKGNYPKLFKQGVADFSALRVEYYKESKDGKMYIKLSNNQPDHGGYSEVYSILVDPFSGEIKENN